MPVYSSDHGTLHFDNRSCESGEFGPSVTKGVMSTSAIYWIADSNRMLFVAASQRQWVPLPHYLHLSLGCLVRSSQLTERGACDCGKRIAVQKMHCSPCEKQVINKLRTPSNLMQCIHAQVF